MIGDGYADEDDDDEDNVRGCSGMRGRFSWTWLSEDEDATTGEVVDGGGGGGEMKTQTSPGAARYPSGLALQPLPPPFLRFLLTIDTLRLRLLDLDLSSHSYSYPYPSTPVLNIVAVTYARWKDVAISSSFDTLWDTRIMRFGL